ncbi:MAG: NFACT family protein [Raineya sp.]
MHQNYYFLKPLSEALQQKMQGMELATCFTQNKDEIIFGFCNAQEDCYIRASLQADFACFHLLTEFQRAKKNTLELFEEVIGKKIVAISAIENDRSLAFYLEDNFTLLFKMYGSRANIILFEQDTVVDIFHKKLQNDWDYKLSSLPKKIEQTFENFLQQGLKKTFPTFDKLMLAQIDQQAPADTQWQQIQSLLKAMQKGNYYVGNYENQLVLSLIDILDNAEVFQNPIEALNAYYYAFARTSHFQKEKQTATRRIEKILQKTQNYIDKTLEKIAELDDSKNLEKIGHILMANLHQIPEKAEKITLHNFYTGKEITIKLKADLSPQKNAEYYYKKSKNQKIELEKLEENLQARRLYLDVLRNHLQNIEQITTSKALRSYLKDNKLDFQETKVAELLPFKSFCVEGFTILVGKNAQNNDLLTQKYAYKEDLWLHAKDVSGSHVLVKYQSGKIFPKNVIEKAAQIAAYFSKRRNESLCPVIVTPRKFVRKTKDLDFGQVIVEKETVVMVVPQLPE